jgi:hypothetical protein
MSTHVIGIFFQKYSKMYIFRARIDIASDNRVHTEAGRIRRLSHIGSALTESDISISTCITRFRHCSPVSPGFTIDSMIQSLMRSVRKQTASIPLPRTCAQCMCEDLGTSIIGTKELMFRHTNAEYSYLFRFSNDPSPSTWVIAESEEITVFSVGKDVVFIRSTDATYGYPWYLL